MSDENLSSFIVWKAKKAEENGRIDAIWVSGVECGCIASSDTPNAPYRVFGYTMDCQDFNYPCHTFVEMVKAVRRLNDGCNTLFIKGASESVQDYLLW